MYKMRLAAVEDLETLLDMSRQFHATTKYVDMGFDEDSTVMELLHMIDDGLLVVGHPDEDESQVIAMLGGVYGHLPFNHAVKVFHEKMFWIDEAHRGNSLAAMMIKAAEIGAKEDDCDATVMSKLATSPEHVDKLYRVLGYEERESSYLRRLT
jgi:GNAT superfamily N-acetyltransferase